MALPLKKRTRPMSIPPQRIQSRSVSLLTIAAVYEYSRMVSLAEIALLKQALVDCSATTAVVIPAIPPRAALYQYSGISEL